MEGNSAHSSDKNPAAPTSDLGSSFDSASSDAKSHAKLGSSDDVISVDGSASLTLDSLEEEEEEAEEDAESNEEKRQENGDSEATQADLAPNPPDVSRDRAQICQCPRSSDAGNQTAVKMEACHDKGHVSDLAVHTKQNKPSASKPTKPSRKTLANNADSSRGSAGRAETTESAKDGQATLCEKRPSVSSDSGGQTRKEEQDGKVSEPAGESTTSSEQSAPERTAATNAERSVPAASDSQNTTTVNDPDREEPNDSAAPRCSHCGRVGKDSSENTAGAADTTPSQPEADFSERVVVVGDGNCCEESSTDPDPHGTSASCHDDLKTSPPSPHHPHPHPHPHPHLSPAKTAPATPPASLRLRKTRSLTETGDGRSSPSRTSRRSSGIPRRKSYAGDYSRPVYSTSSDRNTPQTSPASFRRSLPLSSANLTRHNSLRQSSSPRSADSSPGTTTGPASFPQSPVKVCGGSLKRSSSHMDNVSTVSSCFSTPLSRDTITSRLRFEKHHQDHDRDPMDKADAYLTPSQRKDLLIKDLRAQVKDLNRQLDLWQRHDLRRKEDIEEETEQTIAKLREEVEEARSVRDSAQQEVTSLKESHEQSVKTVATLQQELERVKKDMASQMSQAEDIFLEMYKKGRESAIFEREEELEFQGKGKRSPDALETELRHKLERTQAELAKWQTMQRHESYHTSLMPGTEAETTLRFLKDAVFHYLTADRKAVDEHLRAIVRILRFSDVQREKIAYAIIHRRNKSGW